MRKKRSKTVKKSRKMKKRQRRNPGGPRASWNLDEWGNELPKKGTRVDLRTGRPLRKGSKGGVTVEERERRLAEHSKKPRRKARKNRKSRRHRNKR